MPEGFPEFVAVEAGGVVCPQDDGRARVVLRPFAGEAHLPLGSIAAAIDAEAAVVYDEQVGVYPHGVVHTDGGEDHLHFNIVGQEALGDAEDGALQLLAGIGDDDSTDRDLLCLALPHPEGQPRADRCCSRRPSRVKVNEPVNEPVN